LRFGSALVLSLENSILFNSKQTKGIISLCSHPTMPFQNGRLCGLHSFPSQEQHGFWSPKLIEAIRFASSLSSFVLMMSFSLPEIEYLVRFSFSSDYLICDFLCLWSF